MRTPSKIVAALLLIVPLVLCGAAFAQTSDGGTDTGGAGTTTGGDTGGRTSGDTFTDTDEG